MKQVVNLHHGMRIPYESLIDANMVAEVKTAAGSPIKAFGDDGQAPISAVNRKRISGDL